MHFLTTASLRYVVVVVEVVVAENVGVGIFSRALRPVFKKLFFFSPPNLKSTRIKKKFKPLLRSDLSDLSDV